jgi:RNA-directed DNA polymerase
MGTTETLNVTQTKLNRIAWLSKQDPNKEFECLMHLFNKESLLECFYGIDGNKAVGIDGMTKEVNVKALIGKSLESSWKRTHFPKQR